MLEEEEFERVGGTSTLKVDVRVVATTNRDLAAEVSSGRFREDLYYRLHVLPIHMQPLRNRRDDVLPLAEHFVALYAQRNGLEAPGISPEVQAQLLNWDWPGNVRELENVIQRAVVLLNGSQIGPADLSFGPGTSAASGSDSPANLSGTASLLANRCWRTSSARPFWPRWIALAATRPKPRGAWASRRGL